MSNDEFVRLKKKRPDEVDARDITKLSASNLYKLTMNHDIPFHKVGHTVLFKIAELQNWIESSRVPTNAEIETEAAAVVNRRRR